MSASCLSCSNVPCFGADGLRVAFHPKPGSGSAHTGMFDVCLKDNSNVAVETQKTSNGAFTPGMDAAPDSP